MQPPTDERARGHRRPPLALLAVLLLALAINLVGVTWGLPARTSWAPDSIAPTGPLVYAKHILETDSWWSEYPGFHYAVLAAAYGPYLGYLWLTGQLLSPDEEYPYGLSEPVAALGRMILIARLVSVLMGVGILVALYLVGRELFDARSGIFAALIVCFSPVLIYYSHNACLDVPYLFWSAWALWALLRYRRGGSPWFLSAATLLAALAVATKDQAYGLFLFPALLLLRGADRRWAWPRGGGRALLLGALAYLAASGMGIDPRGWWEHVRYITGPASDPYQTFAATAGGYLGLMAETLLELGETMGFPALLLCLAGVAAALRRPAPGTGLMLGAAASYLVTFVGVILYVYPRFVLPVVLILAVFGGAFASRLWSARPALRAAVVSVLLYSAAYGLAMDVRLLSDSRYQAEAWMERRLPVGAMVGVDGQEAYLPRFPGDVRVVPVIISRDGVESRSRQDPDYLLFSSAQYRRYWNGKACNAEKLQGFNQLLRGDAGYAVEAVFDDDPVLLPELIPTVSPRIILLGRTDGGQRYRADRGLPRAPGETDGKLSRAQGDAGGPGGLQPRGR